jgi:hypothetical protein
VDNEQIRPPASLEASRAMTPPTRFEASPVCVCNLLRLRTSDRSAQSSQLDKYAQEYFGECDLSSVGSFAELGSTEQSWRSFAIRTRPSELMLISLSPSPPPASSDTAKLFGRHRLQDEHWPLIFAVEDTDGLVAFRLTGNEARSVLLRLADATSLPEASGRATRLRMADLPGLVAWHGDGYTILIPAPSRTAFVNWLHYVLEGMGLDTTQALSGI